MSRSNPDRTQSPGRRLAPALGLFFLAPLVGEFLLGNLPITWLWTLLTLAPLYGGGALLIREIARRAGFGWPSILILGLAYAVVEEAFVTQSLFNPDYVGLRLLDFGYIPALGIGAWWTVFVLGLHTIWSTAVPIALVEAMSTRSRRTPWLGPIGLTVTVLLFVAGCVVTAGFQPPPAFHASVLQLATSAVIVVLLVGLAWWVGRRDHETPAAGGATQLGVPSPVGVAGVGFAGGSVFMALALVNESIPAAANVAGMLGALAATAVVTLRWSRRVGWTEQHRFAAAAGFLLTYMWYGFVQVPSVGEASGVVNLVGDVVFSLGAILLLIVAHWRLARPVGAVRTP